MIDQILLNNTDKIEIDVYYNGVLTAPDDIEIKYIKDVDSVTRLSNGDVVAGDSTGRYYFNVPASITDKEGIYTAVWEFTIGTTVFTHTQYFEVTGSIRTGYTTVNQFRDNTISELVADDYPSDSTIEKHIRRASKLIDRYLGGSIEYAQHTETVRCAIDQRKHGLHIQLKSRPIQSLTSVSITTTPHSVVSLNTDDIRINAKAGYLEYLYNYSTPHSLRACLPITDSGVVPHATVTYTAGYTSIPEAVTEATIMMTEALIANTFGEGQDVQSIKVNKDTVRYSDSAEVRKAKNLLGINNAEGIINLLKEYKNYKPIIAGPYTR